MSACHEVLGPDAARDVFARLSTQAGSDGCTLTDLHTEPTRMTVRWSKGGQPMPEATLTPTGCLPGDAVVPEDTLALDAPPGLTVACPDAVAAMTAAVHTLHPSTAKLPPAYSSRLAVTSWLGLALALVGALLVAILTLRRGSA